MENRNTVLATVDEYNVAKQPQARHRLAIDPRPDKIDVLKQCKSTRLQVGLAGGDDAADGAEVLRGQADAAAAGVQRRAERARRVAVARAPAARLAAIVLAETHRLRARKVLSPRNAGYPTHSDCRHSLRAKSVVLHCKGRGAHCLLNMQL